jgi:hypothetical protein
MGNGNRILVVALFLLAGIVVGCSRSGPAPAPPATYAGVRTTHTVHKAGCGFIGRALPANRVPFDHLADALAEGYRPCRHCLRAAATVPAIRHGGGPATPGGSGKEKP